MRVLMLNPPFMPGFSRGQRSPAVTKSATLYYPIWLSYATAALERDGHEVRLVDAVAAGLALSDLERMVAEQTPGLIIVDTSTPSIDSDIEVGVRLKRRAAGALLGAVGPHVSALPEETLAIDRELDFVCVREYDATVSAVASAVDGAGDWRQVPGLVLRADGATHRTPPAEPVADLDDYPFVSDVYRRHLDYRHYFYAITRHPVVTIVSGRGCPYKCNYCMFPQTLHGHQYRRRSVANVADEFQYIEKHFPGAREVFIEDDTLTLHRSRTRELCEELIRRGIKIRWTANARCDVDRETLEVMKAAGCRLLCVGVESGVQEILDNVGKGIRIEQIEEFFTVARDAGVMVHGCFMAGNRGETEQTLEQTLRFALRLDPDTAQFFPLMVYPGTRAYQWAEELGLLRAQSFRDWLTPNGMHSSVVDSEHLTHEQLVAWCDTARRRFYLRPRYLLRKLIQSVGSRAEAGRTLRSLATFARHLVRRSGV